MSNDLKTNFPDKVFLEGMVAQLEEKNFKSLSSLERLSAQSGAALNWIADYINDQNIVWTKERVSVEKIYLTGTNPRWNKIILINAKEILKN